MSKRKGTWTTVWAICGAFCFVFGVVYAVTMHTGQLEVAGSSIGVPSLQRAPSLSSGEGTIGPQEPAISTGPPGFSPDETFIKPRGAPKKGVTLLQNLNRKVSVRTATW
jgi:hypothetical protein